MVSYGFPMANRQFSEVIVFHRRVGHGPRLDIPSTLASSLADAFMVPEDAVNLSDLVSTRKLPGDPISKK